MSERGEIKRAGGKSQKNSGRGKIQKGDAILAPFCYDVKEYAESFGVNRNVWTKACMDAYKSGQREPALNLVLGKGAEVTRLWVIGDDMFQQMREAWLEKYGE